MTAQYQYINSISEFFTHTKLHQQRVFHLGMWLYHKHPESFDDISPISIDCFLRLHDQAKFLPARGWGALGPLTFLEHLYRFYGSTTREEFDPEIKAEIIQDMNNLEQKLGDSYLESDQTIPASELAVIREKLRMIENIADLVDRGQCPVSQEEFGHPLVPASEFLVEGYTRKLARELENSYEEIVGRWSYEAYLKG